MKIFNWVHRRFNHKADGLAQDEKKSGLMINADESSHDEKQLLHENINALSNVLDGWRGGILTIGTFGYDPLRHEHEHEMEQNDAPFYGQELEQLPALEINDERQITDSEEEDDEQGEEENPLVYAAYEHDYEGLLGMKVEGDCRVSTKDEIEIEFEFEFDGISMMNSTKKERTTLAELFSADSEDELQKKLPISKGQVIKENKPNFKHGFSFAKKLMGDQDVRPIHKLHRLMRRMLRRKIHPDVQGLNKRNPVDSSGKVVAKKCETATTESASLLPTLTPVADAII